MKGPAGYGRYNDDPRYVGCPRAKSDMSPCIARDGHLALSSGLHQVCVFCDREPAPLIRELAAEYQPARRQRLDGAPALLADRLRDLVRAATEPAAGQ